MDYRHSASSSHTTYNKVIVDKGGPCEQGGCRGGGGVQVSVIEPGFSPFSLLPGD